MSSDSSAPNIITIVNARDEVIGSEERSTARQLGLTHRMVKVIIYNQLGQVLFQQRSANKEDSPLKWDLSATGHVDAGEDYLEAALRETNEEVGITDLSLTLLGKYYYERPKGSLVIRRFNAIFTSHTTQEVVFDTKEVAGVRWADPSEIPTWLRAHPDDFTRSAIEIFDQFGPQILATASQTASLVWTRSNNVDPTASN